MNIGSMRHRMTLQSTTKTADGMGGWIKVAKDEATVWGSIWPISASEQVQAMQTGMTITHRIRIRYMDRIKASWRMKYRTKYFNIISILNLNMKNEKLELIVKETESE